MGFFSVDLIVVVGGAFCAVAAGPVKEPARSAPPRAKAAAKAACVGGAKAWLCGAALHHGHCGTLRALAGCA